MRSVQPSASARMVAILAKRNDDPGVKGAEQWRSLRAAAVRRIGAEDRFVQSLMAVVRADAIAGCCSIAGIEGRYTARDAAFANGALMASEGSMPVAAIVAAVMALSDETQSRDADAIAAVGFGLHVLERLERAAGDGMRARGHLAEGLVGVPAAAAAAGRILGLSDAAMADALGVAGSLASGSREWLGEDAALQGGWIARSAVLAAKLAQFGFSGPGEVFEGRKGLFNAYAGAGNYSVEPLTAGDTSDSSFSRERS
jgi:2-methylcitrate dehydratase PrpD